MRNNKKNSIKKSEKQSSIADTPKSKKILKFVIRVFLYIFLLFLPFTGFRIGEYISANIVHIPEVAFVVYFIFAFLPFPILLSCDVSRSKDVLGYY